MFKRIEVLKKALFEAMATTNVLLADPWNCTLVQAAYRKLQDFVERAQNAMNYKLADKNLQESYLPLRIFER